jgi:hypothetical protein
MPNIWLHGADVDPTLAEDVPNRRGFDGITGGCSRSVALESSHISTARHIVLNAALRREGGASDGHTTK